MNSSAGQRPRGRLRTPGMLETRSHFTFHLAKSPHAAIREGRVSPSCRADDLSLDDLGLLDREVQVVPQAHTQRAFDRYLSPIGHFGRSGQKT